MPFLKRATINYGTRQYHVAGEGTVPLPLQFDFADPEACARKVFAVMSNASGGHAFRDCKVRYHLGRRTANLTSSGCHVYYADDAAPKLDLDKIEAYMAECVTIELGTVSTDQYGDGWERARWSK